MPVSASMSVLSTAYVSVPVFTQYAGTSVDPTSDQVQFAFKPVGAEPSGGDWLAGDWLAGTTTGTYVAQCLVGPGAGAAITLDPGVYAIWMKITDSPEVPVLQPGTLQITVP